jgi:uncharacterized protein (TIGR02001 family)
MAVTRLGRRLLGTALVATASAAAAQAVKPWGGALNLTSDYVFRGVTQTDGDAAVQADLHAQWGSGWFAGAWASTVKPAPSYHTSHELELYAGRGWALSDRWAATIAVVRYLYPDAPPYSHYDASELSAALRFDDRLSLAAAVAPDARRYSVAGWSPRGQARAYELALRQPLAGPVALLAAAGLYDTDALFGESYRAWDMGLAARLGPIDLAVLRFGVDAAARRLFGADAADGRWVVSVGWRF